MEILKYINNFLLIILVLSGIVGAIDQRFLWITVLLPIIIGLYQSIVGIILFLLHPKSIRFQLYVGGLVLFVIACYLPISNTWMILPIPLLMYFTFMIHTVHQEKHEYTTYKTT